MSPTRRTPAVVLALAALLAGCSSGSTDDPAPRPSSSASGGLTDAQQQLAALAGLAAAASYDATYDLDARTGDKGTIRIVALPPSFRVDVTLRGAEPSIYIQKNGTVVSCRLKTGKASCFLVARPGEPVPEIFDPGVQRLFSDAVADLGANPGSYVVDVIPSEPLAVGTVPATCFDVRRAPPTEPPSTSPGPSASATEPSPSTSPSPSTTSADPTGFETGQYCFADDGLLTRVAVSTGTLVLKSRGAAPTLKLFDAPAKPAELPALPAASPTR